jgi:light-regulated signal transduction histidine kinase (bacteriophytochrome)
VSQIQDLATDSLFMSLAEQVKTPFVHISYAAELLASADDSAHIEQLRQSISLASRGALNLIDSYLLSVSLQRDQQLELEPVSVSAVLHDCAQHLLPYARSLGCELNVTIEGKFTPVMAHRAALQSALTSLGYSFIEATVSQEEVRRPQVTFVVRRRAQTVNTGVFSNTAGMSPVLLKRARKLRGISHQPLPGFMSGNASGVFVADALFSKLEATMKVAQNKGLQGLAVSLNPSRQLQLV